MAEVTVAQPGFAFADWPAMPRMLRLSRHRASLNDEQELPFSFIQHSTSKPG